MQPKEIRALLLEAEGLLALLEERPADRAELTSMTRGRLLKALEALGTADTRAPEDTRTLAPEDTVGTEDYDTDFGSEPLYALPDDDDFEGEEEGQEETPEMSAAAVPESNPKPVPAAETSPASGPRTEAPQFCLNDRFRFRRTVFGGSEADFNATIQALTGVAGWEEAERILVDETGLDPEDPETAEFLAVIKQWAGQ